MKRREAGRKLLAAVKECAGRPGPQLALQVDSPVVAFLRPVATQRELQNQGDVQCLTSWRNKFVSAFLNEFVATERQTSDWLASVVGPDDGRILFMVDDAEGQTIGYMGIGFIDWSAGYAEADSIVRGGPARKGLMRRALTTLLSWGYGQLGLQTIGVRVRSDNAALDFYRAFGFEEAKRVPLVSRTHENALSWHEAPQALDSEISLVHMTLQRRGDAR